MSSKRYDVQREGEEEDNSAPEWMKRTKNDELDLILRASAAFATHGHAPELERDRQKLSQQIRPADDKGWFDTPASHKGPMTYNSSYTGRALKSNTPAMQQHIQLDRLYIPPDVRSEIEKAKTNFTTKDFKKTTLKALGEGETALSSLRGTILSNANSPARDKAEDKKTGEKNSSTKETNKTGLPMLEDTFPDKLKPSQMMKKYKLFRTRDDRTKGSEDSKEEADPTGLHLGKPGVSAKNRQGDIGDFPYTMNKGGPGMVNGILTVPYENAREATTEAMKWGEVGNIKYKDKEVVMTVKLAPQFYEPFAQSLKASMEDEFTFESQLNPPLFIADIGSKKAKARKAEEYKENDKQLSQSNTLDDSISLKEEQGTKKEQRWPAQIDEQELYKQEMRKEKAKAQNEIDKLFRELAELGETHKMNLLKRQGWQVHADRTPWYQRRELSYEDKRRRLIQKQRDEELRLGKVMDMWIDESEQSVRVYPNIDSGDDEGYTALILAAKKGWEKTVQLLLSIGADHRKKTIFNQTALSLARDESEAASVAIFRRQPGAGERKRRVARCIRLLDTRTLLKVAQDGDYRRARYLVCDEKQNPNLTNKYGMTPLHYAVINHDFEMIKLLSEAGADPEAKNNNGQTPLMLAQAEDDELALDIEKSIGVGRKMKKLRHREAIQRKRQEEEIARKEDLLARELRIYTKGTAAAKAVFTSFRKTNEGSQEPKKETIADTHQSTYVSSRSPSASKVRRKKSKYNLTSDARNAMKPSPHFENLQKKTLSTSWNRHALNFYGKVVKKNSLNEHVAAHKTLSSTSLPAHEEREHMLKASTGAASHEYFERTKSPKNLDKEMRDEQLVPATSDPKFEDWLRFRFGKITTI